MPPPGFLKTPYQNIIRGLKKYYLPNPFYLPELKPLCGQDEPVRDFVLERPVTQSFLQKYTALLQELLPLYLAEGKQYLAIGAPPRAP